MDRARLLLKDGTPQAYAGTDEDYLADVQNWQSKYNFTCLSPNFYVGGQIINKRMMEALEGLGVTHVICCAAEHVAEDMQRGQKCGVKVFGVYWEDTCDVPVPDYRDAVAAYAWYQAAICNAVGKDKLWPTVYVHCHQGTSRGPAMMATLLAALTGESLASTLSLIAARRPVTQSDERPGLLGACQQALRVIRGQPAVVGAPM